MRYLILTFCLLFSSQAYAEELKTYCKPSQSCWPNVNEWQKLNQQVEGRLITPGAYIKPCQIDSKSQACQETLKSISNPFILEDQSGATQSTGWLNAWNSSPSNYVVAAKNTQDIVQAVNFARIHNLKIVIKNTGHDYIGRSNAPDSLLIWTHNMRGVTIHDHFVPQGCPLHQKGIPAVTALAGTRWLEAYGEVVTNKGRYVQGGGCTSVGVAGGFTQGGGFGSFAKKFGLGAGSMLEVEVVTSDGKVLIANDCQNQDLFWALRGGGASTFGVVTKMTLKTHDLPKTFGRFEGNIQAESEASFQKLIAQFIAFFRDNLNTEHWGEQVVITKDNQLKISMVFQGLSDKEAEALWSPFKKWLNDNAGNYKSTFSSFVVPARHMWDYDYLSKYHPQAIVKGGKEENIQYWWWSGDAAQVSHYWFSYQSRWLPSELFQQDKLPQFSKTLFQASRYHDIQLHINKGLSGASPDAMSASHKTAMNPAVFNAPMLLISSAGAGEVFEGIPGHEPDFKAGKELAAAVNSAMSIIRKATPGAGAYINEADYFEENWQDAFWGINYPRLLEIKQKYDPENVFTCHHCVGSEMIKE